MFFRKIIIGSFLFNLFCFGLSAASNTSKKNITVDLKRVVMHKFLTSFYAPENRTNITSAFESYFKSKGMQVNKEFKESLNNFEVKSLMKQNGHMAFELSVVKEKYVIEILDFDNVKSVTVIINGRRKVFDFKNNSFMAVYEYYKQFENTTSSSVLDLVIPRADAYASLIPYGIAVASTLIGTGLAVAEDIKTTSFVLGGRYCCKLVEKSKEHANKLIKDTGRCIGDLSRAFLRSFSVRKVRNIESVKYADGNEFHDHDARLFRMVKNEGHTILTEESDKVANTCNSISPQYDPLILSKKTLKNDPECVTSYAVFKKKYEKGYTEIENAYKACMELIRDPRLRKKKLDFEKYVNESQDDVKKVIKSYESMPSPAPFSVISK